MSDPYAAALSGAAGRSLQLDQVLSTLLRQAPDVEAAAVVSFDGLPMASALPAGMDEDRVAAMSAALLSLGERAAQGLGRGDLSQVYVEGDNGTVFLVSADDEAVLVAVGRLGAKVGLMLFEVKQAADAVGSVLRIEVTPVESPVAQQVEPQEQYQTQPEPQEQYETQPEPQPDVQAETQPVAHHGAHSHPVPESVNGNHQPVPTVVPDPPASTEPQREPVAVPVPREVRESAWDAHTNDPGERRPATVAPDGSAWS